MSPTATARELELHTLPQAPDPPRGGLARLTGPFRRGRPPAPQPAMGFYTDTTVCIGCKACEVACKQWNQLPADGLSWSGHSYDNTQTLSATTWRHVKFIEQFPQNGTSEAARVSLPLASRVPAAG
jgi:formate dehydrogenase iron-sulfur subunit